MFRLLVITRLFSLGSKLNTIDYLFLYQGVSYNISKIYRFLDNLCHRKDEKVKTVEDEIKTWTETIRSSELKTTLFSAKRRKRIL
jgi:hypothetical protein